MKLRSLFSLTFVITALLAAHATAAGDSVIPQKLEIYIGNAVLGAWHVRLHERSLTCTREQNGTPDQNGLPVTPTQKQWQAFRDALAQLRVAQWQQDYASTGVFDGTQWHIDIIYPDRKFAAKGDNNFPDADGKPNSSPIWTTTFRNFVAAVRRLLGQASSIPDDL
ncbi:MAG TPA: hypothetical protein VGW57_02145 [Chthoniobacterales bacterium]|nr:hypothetical protein [Chthoniobacterales bacterium]